MSTLQKQLLEHVILSFRDGNISVEEVVSFILILASAFSDKVGTD